MTRWFRFYDEALDDPKVQALSADDFRGWVNILCVASKNNGRIPEGRALSFALRMSEIGAGSLVDRLTIAGLIDRVKGGPNGSSIAPHNWAKRQYKSDTSTDRVKRFRKRCETVTETAPETEADTETETEINHSTIESKGCASDAPVVTLHPSPGPFDKFPADGSIAYSPWADVARKYGGGQDIDMLASNFRKFCHAAGIPFDRRGILKTFVSFCQKHKTRVYA